jgi:oligosaccharyl transferase (archaeosortase A-associated)
LPMNLEKRFEPAEVLAIALVAFSLRLFAGRLSLTEKGIVFPGYDEYYHIRRILYTVNNFPHTLWFDSYLNYPHGLDITWPPLFDQICAGLSLAFGQHSQPGVEMVSALVPAVVGTLAAVVIYYLVKELFNSTAALLASFMTALAPNYLVNTLFASIDHHGLEVLLQLCTILFIAFAISRGEKRYLFAALGGLAMAALAYTWGGADVYLGIFPIYLAVLITIDLRNGVFSRQTGETLLAAFGLALILVLPFWKDPWISPSFIGLAAMIGAMLVMLGLGWFIRQRNVSWMAFPLCLLALVVLFFLLSWLMGGLSGLGLLVSGGLQYIWGGKMAGRIAEAEPLIYDADTLFAAMRSVLGLNFIFTVAGIAACISYFHASKGGRRQGQLLLLVWVVVSLLLTIGQKRFLYLSSISIGVFISILAIFARDLMQRKWPRPKHKHTTTAVAGLMLLLILPTLSDTAYVAFNSYPDITGDWFDSLVWLRENTNATSYYDNPTQKAEYGVMSWWDYGNWILYLAKRPVVANNFQAGLEDSAKFYLSESEEEASSVLDARGSKYILANYFLIYDKLPSLANWANEDIYSYLNFVESDGNIIIQPQERLYRTTLGRLYLLDGAGMAHFRLIHESKTFLGQNPPKSEVKIFEYVPGALLRVKGSPDQKAGALLNLTSNQGRDFVYINEGSFQGGMFEIRVPYSTDNRNGTHALGPYLVFVGNKFGIEKLNVDVSEEEIRAGKTIDVDL